jgi:ABC-type antimicrobial peptide transport system permease subunit
MNLLRRLQLRLRATFRKGQFDREMDEEIRAHVEMQAQANLEAGRLAAIGVVGGLLLALWMTRLLRSQLYEVSPTDPAVFAAVALLLFAVALLACLLPAIRATRVDPMSTLRSE